MSLFLSQTHPYQPVTHTYSTEDEVAFCFTPMLTFNSRDNSPRGQSCSQTHFNVFQHSAIIKNEPQLCCDNGKVDWESGFGIGLHIISCAIKMGFPAIGENKSRFFVQLLNHGRENAVILMYLFS